jgi:hypothetical protein
VGEYVVAFLYEPQPEKVGVLFFIGTTCSPNGSDRRLSFEKPCSNEWGFLVFMWFSVFHKNIKGDFGIKPKRCEFVFL